MKVKSIMGQSSQGIIEAFKHFVKDVLKLCLELVLLSNTQHFNLLLAVSYTHTGRKVYRFHHTINPLLLPPTLANSQTCNLKRLVKKAIHLFQYHKVFSTNPLSQSVASGLGQSIRTTHTVKVYNSSLISS